MRLSALVLLATTAPAALAQDLITDFQRAALPNLRTTEYESIPPFQIGFVGFREQVLLQYPVQALRSNSDKVTLANPEIFGASSPNFGSGIWWNFGDTSFTLPNGRPIPAQTVMMFSADRIPVIQITRPKGAPGLRAELTVTLAPGQSTPGRFVCQRYDGRGWMTLYDQDLSRIPGQVFSDTEFFNFTTEPGRIRWMLIRSGSLPARAYVTLTIK